MFRKSIVAIAAVAALTAFALPGTASAHKGGGKGGGSGGKPHFHHFRSIGFVSSGFSTGCYRYKWVETRFGLQRVLVNICSVY